MTTDVQQWQIGDVRVTKVVETVVAWRFSILLPDCTPELVDSVPWMRPHFVDDDGKMLLSIHTLVVESQGRRILVDTCIGNDKARPSRSFNMLQTDFLTRLGAAGFPPETIDVVTCTHLHVDHVGWNTRLDDGVWVPTFPNARHLFNRAEYEYWHANPDEEMNGTVIADSVEPVVDAGLVDLVDEDHRITDEVWLEPTPGHTPGHVCVRISSAGQDAIITGDMIHSPIQVRYNLSCGVDTDRDLGDRTRAAFVERYGDSGTLVIGTHFATPTAGHIVRDGANWKFEV
ncbi:MAG: MBL fold metallo-hydrolase [Actinobacteria bacterium]|nr:MBL fold metallo-hydrolase [Actinomycetota bacterium]